MICWKEWTRGYWVVVQVAKLAYVERRWWSRQILPNGTFGDVIWAAGPRTSEWTRTGMQAKINELSKELILKWWWWSPFGHTNIKTRTRFWVLCWDGLVSQWCTELEGFWAHSWRLRAILLITGARNSEVIRGCDVADWTGRILIPGPLPDGENIRICLDWHIKVCCKRYNGVSRLKSWSHEVPKLSDEVRER